MQLPEHKPAEFVWHEASGRRIRFWPAVKWIFVITALAWAGWSAIPKVVPVVASLAEKLMASRPAELPPSERSAGAPAEPAPVPQPVTPPATPWSEVPEGTPSPEAATAPTGSATTSVPPPTPATPLAEVPGKGVAPSDAPATQPVPVQPPSSAGDEGIPPLGNAAAVEGGPQTAPPAAAAEPDTSAGEPEPEPESGATDSFSAKPPPAGTKPAEPKPKPYTERLPRGPNDPDPAAKGDGYWNGTDFN